MTLVIAVTVVTVVIEVTVVTVVTVVTEFFVCFLSSLWHCESGNGLWLQGEAVLHMHSFRDAEPQPVIPPNAKQKSWNIYIF